MTRTFVITLSILIAGGAGCGSCLDDKDGPPPAQGNPAPPIERGPLKVVNRPGMHLQLVGAEAGIPAVQPSSTAGSAGD